MTEMPTYDETLKQLAVDRPRLAAALQAAQDRRTHHTARLRTGARLHGVDELLTRLDGVVERFLAEPALEKLTFLIGRCIADFETAIEATLSGYVSVCHDAMRDVMEIELLLRDFFYAPDNIETWLTADDSTLRRKFTAVKVRERLHSAQDACFMDNSESLDYRGHSQALHVRPHGTLLPGKGRVSSDNDGLGFGGDSGYWEIFEHARRLLDAVRKLVGKLAPNSPTHQFMDEAVPVIQDAWERTQQSQTVFLALVQAVFSKKETEGPSESS